MGRLWRNRGMIGVILFAVIIVVITGAIAIKNRSRIDYIIKDKKYDATKAIESAREKLKEGKGQAQVITDVKTTEKVVALTFKGLSDTKTNEKILDLLNKYERKGTFFIPGILAAEDSEFVQLMSKNGHKIGSNSLSGTSNMDEFENDDLINDFSKANTILSTLSGESPSSIMFNSTNLTSEVLNAAFACGNENVVDSSHFFSYQSFSDYNQVLDYIENAENGTILTIKMDGVLEEYEYEKSIETLEKEDLPDTQENPITELSFQTSNELSDEDRLVQMIEWILQSLNETGYKTVFVEDLPDYEDLDFAMDFAEFREKNHGKLAKVLKSINTESNMASFTFRGISNKEKLEEILEYLDSINMKATFFVTVDEIVSYQDRVKLILDKGHEVGNGGMSGKDLTAMDFHEICLEIYKCDKLLKEKFLVSSDRIMPVYGKYNNLVLEAASSLGYSVVTYSKNPLTAESQTIDDIKKYFKNGIRRGDIVFFRLDFHESVLEAVKETYELVNKSDYQMVSVSTLLQNELAKSVPTAKNDTVKEDTSNEPVPQTIAEVNNATSNNNSSDSKGTVKEPTEREKLIEQLRMNNNGIKATGQSTVYTTEQALSYTFYGVSRTDVLEDVLNKLDALSAKGTFYVTEKDVKTYGEQIKNISDRGHEIGICLSESTGMDYNSVCNSILDIIEGVEKISGQKPVLVRYAYDITVTDEILEAISSTGCKLVWQDLSMASSSVGADATLEDVMNYAFNEGNIAVKRGYIIYYRMDYYNDPYLIGNIMLAIAKDRINTVFYNDNIVDNGSAYRLKPLGSLICSDKVYTYPVNPDTILASVKDVIHEGYLAGLSDTDKFEILKSRYTGNPDISTENTLPGFSPEELTQMNKTGRFTDVKTLFLTFDDWGSDKPVNQILYVLRKYNVKATFFIRTNYVQNNPNLLRAIAEEGHDIGSHTDMHFPYATTDNVVKEEDTTSTYYSLTEEEVLERKADLKVSYDRLQSIIGDVQTDGRQALITVFRPPTLAMSKPGMEAIFDMGFTHILSGDFSTHDYEEIDSTVLAEKILNGIPNGEDTTSLQNGSVMVLHMSDDSITATNQPDVTAQSLDIIIPRLLAEGYSFEKISNYLPYSR